MQLVPVSLHSLPLLAEGRIKKGSSDSGSDSDRVAMASSSKDAIMVNSTSRKDFSKGEVNRLEYRLRKWMMQVDSKCHRCGHPTQQDPGPGPNRPPNLEVNRSRSFPLQV